LVALDGVVPCRFIVNVSSHYLTLYSNLDPTIQKSLRFSFKVDCHGRTRPSCLGLLQLRVASSESSFSTLKMSLVDCDVHVREESLKR
jgi:hypothetical protein